MLLISAHSKFGSVGRVSGTENMSSIIVKHCSYSNNAYTKQNDRFVFESNLNRTGTRWYLYRKHYIIIILTAFLLPSLSLCLACRKVVKNLSVAAFTRLYNSLTVVTFASEIADMLIDPYSDQHRLCHCVYR